MNFTAFKEKYLVEFETFLESSIVSESETQLEEAMNYSLNANGKRLRPILLLATIYFFNKEVKKGMEAAGALEMIHTYSLIHDDLPAMDNDDLRRGLPTNHIKFSESTAILAGDSLLTYAFEILTSADLPADKVISLVKLLGQSSGYKGMVGGQQADINGENSQLTIEDLEKIHYRKTGELIRFALVGGGIIAHQNNDTLDELSKISYILGVAYQIRDDILDVVGTVEDLGKEVGSDEKLNKSTYPALLGLDQAKERLVNELNKAKDLVENISSEETNEEVLIGFINQLYLEEQE